MSCRRLVALAWHLPAGASIWGHDGWGVDDELAAAAVEKLDEVVKTIARLGGVRKSKLGKPLRIPRPYERRPKTAAEKWLDFARVLMRR